MLGSGMSAESTTHGFLQAAEFIPGGRVVAIASDGCGVVLAQLLSGPDIRAFGVSHSGVQSGMTGRFCRRDFIDGQDLAGGVVSGTVGKSLYLGSGGMMHGTIGNMPQPQQDKIQWVGVLMSGGVLVQL